MEIKITILLGFLGSGKTTFLKKFLTSKNNSSTAIIVNEFGHLNIDGNLLKNFNLTIKEINNGSIFCSCKSDKFLKALEELIDMGYNNIIIESSGLSNPISMDKIFSYLENKKNFNFKISTIGICDSKTLYKLVHTNILIKQQIIASDLILLNKIDLSSEEELTSSFNIIKELNKEATILKCTQCNINLDNLIIQSKAKFFLPNNKLLNLKKIVLSLDGFKIEYIKTLILEIHSWCYRIKGLTVAAEGIYFIDVCTSSISISPSEDTDKSGIVVLYPDSNEARVFIQNFSKNIII